MTKAKVAFFDFACCEGCQLAALDLEAPELLDLLDLVEIVEFREAISETGEEYDVAFIEGSITRESDIPRLEDIRKRSKLLIALGACAHIAGFNALKNFQKPSEYQKAVYPEAPDKYESGVARQIDEVVKVDAFVPGCPIDTKELLMVIRNLLSGKRPGIADYPVCVECKNNENQCVYEKGLFCLGPVIRAGCNARCPSNGGYCFGCRGLVSEPEIEAMQNVMKEHGLSQEELEEKFKLCLERSGIVNK